MAQRLAIFLGQVELHGTFKFSRFCLCNSSVLCTSYLQNNGFFINGKITVQNIKHDSLFKHVIFHRKSYCTPGSIQPEEDKFSVCNALSLIK